MRTLLLFLLASLSVFAQTKAANSYRLEFVVRETQSNQGPSERKYLMMADGRSNARINAGTRVPFREGERTQYLDLGTNILCQVLEREGSEQVRLDCNFEVSEIAAESPAGVAPRITSRRSNAVITAQPGKAIQLVAMEDGLSGRTQQISVTISRLTP
jgi:hypothetical protein